MEKNGPSPRAHNRAVPAEATARCRALRGTSRQERRRSQVEEGLPVARSLLLRKLHGALPRGRGVGKLHRRRAVAIEVPKEAGATRGAVRVATNESFDPLLDTLQPRPLCRVHAAARWLPCCLERRKRSLGLRSGSRVRLCHAGRGRL